MRKQFVDGLVFSLVLIAANVPLYAQDRVVLGIVGNWWGSDERKLGFASPVADACVYGESGSLQVGDANSGDAQVFVFEKMSAQCPDTCPARPKSVPPGLHCGKWTSPGEGVAEASVVGGGVIAKVFHLLVRSPQAYVVAAARGLEEEPREAVLPVKGSDVDVAAALQTVAPGTYTVTLEPLDEKSSAKPAVGKIMWKSGASAMLARSGLRPGLYKLDLAVEAGESEATEAWVLLSPAARYSVDVEEFQRMSAITEHWGDRVDVSGKRALLRACLRALSERDAGR